MSEESSKEATERADWAVEENTPIADNDVSLVAHNKTDQSLIGREKE